MIHVMRMCTTGEGIVGLHGARDYFFGFFAPGTGLVGFFTQPPRDEL